MADLRQKTQAAGGQDLVVTPVGGIYTVSWVGRYGDLNIQALEYGRAIHHDPTYYGLLPGRVAEAGIMGSQ